MSARDENAVILREEERTRCEVFTRVMGYHRPVSFFNPGKRQEFADRRMFREPEGCAAWNRCGANWG